MKTSTLAVLTALYLACTASAQTQWSTLFGTPGDTRIFAMKTDFWGRIYVCGQTDSSPTHVTPGAFQGSNQGGIDAFVACLDPTLPPANQLVWGTHLGGIGDEGAYDLDVNQTGNRVVVVGYTNGGFPVTGGAYQQTYGGGFRDGFIAELDPTAVGTSQLVWASYFGGDQEDFATTVHLRAGVTTVGGITASTGLATPGSFQTGHGGGLDAFVARLNPGGSTARFATYLGGSGNEGLSSQGGSFHRDVRTTQLDVDSLGRTTIGTWTFSSNLSSTRSYNPGDYDLYVAQLDATGTRLLLGTYLGGSGRDFPIDVRVDGDSLILAGSTLSPDFPFTANAFQTSANPNPSGLQWSGVLVLLHLPTDQIVYSTYVAGGTWDGCTAATRTSTGDILVTGVTQSGGLPVTPGAPRTGLAAAVWDGYLMRLRPQATSTQLVYSTFFGGSAWQLIWALEPDARGGVIVAGTTTSSNFPTTANAYDPNFSGIIEGFVAIHEMLPASVSRLGTATTPCMTPTHAQMNGAPGLGGTLDIECHDAPANAFGGLVVGIAQQPLGVGVPVFNARTFVDPSLVFGSVLTRTDPLGFASVPLTIPPSIQGTGTYAFQFFWVNPPSCAPSGFLTASNALRW